MKTWQDHAVDLDAEGHSWRSIATKLGKGRTAVADYLRSVRLKGRVISFERFDELIRADLGKTTSGIEDNRRVLFISDMHIPYHHPNLLPWLYQLKLKYEPTRVICLGDELDKHALSFHDSDPDLHSAGDELEKSLPIIKEVEKLFPKMDLIDSNHGSMVFRKAHANGIPRRYIRPYNEVLNVGPGWKWHHDLVIRLPDGQDVYIHHGKTVEAIRTSQLMGMSHVCGHYHESFGVKYWANPRGLYWGMNAGCLIDTKSLAFAYNKINPKRPIIGTGLIIDGVPVLEAMPL